MGKLDVIKKLASMGIAATTASLISQEDANAAGIQTIAKALGVTEDVAKEIKKMAANVPPDVFEQNIQAIQKVSQFKKDPKSMRELGRGIDAIAYDAGDEVVKVPRMGKLGKAWNSDRMKIIPSLVEESGYGPKTKTIQTSQNRYQVQEKLSPLGDLSSVHPKFTDDKILNDLKDKELELMFDNKGQRRPLTDDKAKELADIQKQYSNRESEIFKELNIPKEVLDDRFDTSSVDPEKLEEYMKRKLNQKGVSSVVTPSDLHTENVGLDSQGQMKILDTGNFMSLKPEKMTAAMRQRAIKNYIALPEEKAAFKKSLPQTPSYVKEAAAIAPLAITPQSFTESGVNQLKDLYTSVRQPVLEGLNKIGDFVADTTRLPVEQSEEYKQQQRDVARLASQVALDPVNLVSGGSGAALGVADLFLNKEQSPEEELKIKQDAINRLRLK